MKLTRRPRIVLREPTVEDARGISHLLVQSWLATYAGLLPDDFLEGMSVVERQRQLEIALAAPKPPGAFRLVAVLQGEVIGFANAGIPASDDSAEKSAGATPRIGELAVLYIAPERWREGIGRRMARLATKSLLGDGCSQVQAWVVDGNVRAFDFFESQGWMRSDAHRREVMDGHIVRQTRMDYKPVN